MHGRDGQRELARDWIARELPMSLRGFGLSASKPPARQSVSPSRSVSTATVVRREPGMQYDFDAFSLSRS